MLKIINYSLISLFILVNIDISAQSKADSTNIVSTSDAPKYELKLSPQLHTNKLFLGQKEFIIPNLHDFAHNQTYTVENSEKSINDLKLQMKDYLSQRRNLLRDYDLGEFGKYLGYANAFAAVLLAIAHISKYGFK